MRFIRWRKVGIFVLRGWCDDDDIATIKTGDNCAEGLMTDGEASMFIPNLRVVAEDPDRSMF